MWRQCISMRRDFCTHWILWKNINIKCNKFCKSQNINIQLNTLCYLQTGFKDNIEEHEKRSLNDFKTKPLLRSLKMCVMRQGNELVLHTAFEDPLGSERSMTYVLLVDLSPPIGIRLMMTDEFLGMRASSSVYSSLVWALVICRSQSAAFSFSRPMIWRFKSLSVMWRPSKVTVS